MSARLAEPPSPPGRTPPPDRTPPPRRPRLGPAAATNATNAATNAVDAAPNTVAPDAPSRRRRAHRALITAAPRLCAWTSTALGLLAFLDVVWPHHWRLLSAFSIVPTVDERSTVEVVMAVSGLWLLRIGSGLRRRKRAEWWIALLAAAAIGVVDLWRDVWRPVEGCIAVALLALLLMSRRRFTARTDPRARRSALVRVPALLAAGVIGGVALLSLPGHVPAGTTFADRLREAVLSLVGAGGRVAVSPEDFSDAVHAALLGVGLLAASATLLALVRRTHPTAELSDEDDRRLRALLRAHGARDSLGYFALRRDKDVVWSPTGKAAITYRVVSGVALVSADPLGDPEAWPGAIQAYRRLVDDNAWVPAVLGCSEQAAAVFGREYDLNALQFGDEAVLTPGGFSLDGRTMRGVRQACARVERADYTVRVRRLRDLDQDEIDRLDRLAATWRVDPVERGDSMALDRFGEPGADGDCVVATAVQGDEVRGLLHFVPWGGRGLSLDLMRRDRLADNGLNEFMITRVMAACADLGVDRVSLNFAVFRDALERGSRIGAGPVLRLWRRLLLAGSRWWQIESLYRFNDKFHPQWEPRFFCYQRVRDWPRITFAALQAESFIVLPRVLRRVLGHG